MNFTQVVSAEVTEVNRTLFIQANPDFDYDAQFNIVNDTNNNYTNYNLLVQPFIDDSSISGGFSGSFLPPIKFQLDNASTEESNDNLILASVVEFQRKNLLSGASVSWWRCPYYYNTSLGINKDWDVELSIYQIKNPRSCNLSFSRAFTGENWPVIPEQTSYSSLVFQKSYTDCGQTQNNEQYNFTKIGKIPVNDTLLDSNLPLNLNASSPDYNPYNYLVNDAYNMTVDYSMAWFNVTAPIYPNESYMVIWNISDTHVGDDEAGNFWLTMSDIGHNNYGRTLACWNDRNIYEIPLDLDNSVIFQIGMGAGITGAKLEYNSGSDYQDHTSAFTNPSFESNIWGFQEDFNNFLGWTTVNSANAWSTQNPTLDTLDMRFNSSSSTTSATFSIALPTEGEHFKLELVLNPLEHHSGTHSYWSASAGILLGNTVAEHSYIKIIKETSVEDSTGNVTISNRIEYRDGLSSFKSIALPDTIPNELYVSIQTDTASNDILLYIYHQDAPNYVYFARHITGIYTGADTFDGIRIIGEIPTAFVTTITNPNSIAITVNKIIGIERTNFLNGWTTFSLGTAHSKQDYYDGFETIVPDNNIPIPSNTKCFSTTQNSQFASYGYIEQISSVIPAVNLRRAFVDGNYRMMRNDSTEPYANSYFEIRLGGRDAFSSTWSYVTNRYYAIDGSWHQISTGHLTGNFDMFRVRALFSFPATNSGNVDLKFGQFDNIKVYSIYNNPNATVHEFNQIVNRNLTATNYYTLMMPILHSTAPDFEPYISLRFKNSAGATIYNTLTLPSDFYDDFILISIKSSLIPSNVRYVTLVLYNFCSDAYVFLQDRNNDFNLNNEVDYLYNHFKTYNVQSISVTINETFFSPYYSLRATEGQWINSDSEFTTTYFYYVTVKYVRFIDNEPEILSIVYETVDAQNLEVYKVGLKSFGNVYTDTEWKTYLDVRNKASLSDKIVDWLIDSPFGQLAYTIGKFIYKILAFLTPVIEDIINLLIEVIILVISLVIYFLSVWIMWKFVKFWILIGEGKTDEAIAEFTSVTSTITGAVVSTGSKIGGKIK